MTPFKYHIKVIGCPMRAVEARKVSLYLEKNGGTESQPADADTIVFFTCSIISDTVQQTLEHLTTFLSYKKRLILLGCAPGMIRPQLEAVFSGEMLATKDLEQIDSFFPDFKYTFNSIELPTSFFKPFPYGDLQLKGYSRYIPLIGKLKGEKPSYIITGKGCNNACSYCATRKALGHLKTYTWDEITAAYQKAFRAGTRLFIFNGDDTGAYSDSQGKTFEALLKFLDNFSTGSRARWVIENLHPQWFIKYFETIAALSEKKRIREIIVPLQSVSDGVLRSMRRKYNISDIEPLLKILLKNAPDLVLRTHFIIGYPGESVEHIEALKVFIGKRYFSHIVLLRYFETGDPASALITPKIAPEVTEERIQHLKKHIDSQGLVCEMAGGDDCN